LKSENYIAMMDVKVQVAHQTGRMRVVVQSSPALFKWKHFQPEIILLNVRWYSKPQSGQVILGG